MQVKTLSQNKNLFKNLIFKISNMYIGTPSICKTTMENRPTDVAIARHVFSEHELLRLIFNHLDDNFVFVGRDLCIIATNDATLKRLIEYSGKNITSKTSVLDISPVERHFDLIKLYEEVFEGAVKKTETEVKSEKGVTYFENSFKPVKNKCGEIIGALVTSRNITENKKADKQLREAEERWRFALEGANQGVWDWNLKTHEVFYSKSYQALYGYEENELVGTIEQWKERIHPDDKGKINNAIEDHTGGSNAFYESTYRIKCNDGSYRWILARGMLIDFDSNGKAQRMIGTHTDITRQIAAEESYKALFYNNPLPMWTYELNSLRFLSVNDAAIQHYGYSNEEFLSMTIRDIRPKETIAELEAHFAERRNCQKFKSLVRHTKKNGDQIFVEVSTHALENTGEKIVLVVAHDITSKIVAEEELRQSNERFLLASRATSDAIWDWDVITNDLHWGEGIQTLFGFHPKEVSIDMWVNLIHPDDRKKVHDSILEALENPAKSNWKEEYRFAKADGNFSYVLDREFITRDEQGKATRMLGSIQDITDLKYNEQILSLERSIFELSSNPNVEFKHIVESLLKGVEQIHEDAFTSVLLLRPDETVQPFAASRIPIEFTQRLDGLKIGVGEGSCGTAMATKETVIVEDINTHYLWEKYKGLATQFGFHAYWSFPIINLTGKVLGSFSVYFKKIKHATCSELNTFERIRNILRILMEHQWSLNEIKISNERFDTMMKATHDLIWDWNLENNTIYRNASGLQKVYGVASNKDIETMRQWLTRIHPEDLERVHGVITEILQAKEQESFELEYRFKKDDASFTYVFDRGKILRNENGKPIRMIGAAQNINDRKNLEQELFQQALEKQKAINQATVDSQEQERTEIGKELHDNVNQVLTTTKLYLDLALSNHELKDELIEKSTKNILTVINEIRQLSRSLMDPTIGDLGLIDSLNDLMDNINFTRKVHVSMKAERRLEFFLDKNHKLTVFRIIQEALNNVLKYANATDVLISCKLKQESAEITIEDNGIGFNPASVKKGAGLKNIQNRVFLVNGTCKIESAPNQGCKIFINFPLFK